MTVIAIDVGGSAMKGALLTAGGELRHRLRRPTGTGQAPDATVSHLLAAADELAAAARADGSPPAAAGVAVPGVVDETAGVAVWSSNLGFRDLPLRTLVADHLGLPVRVGHDIRAGGLAEARLGAGRDGQDILFVAVGTGIAAAYVTGGRPLPGAHGAAGELGHIRIRPDGPTCRCGASGCLELTASAAGIARRYTEQAGRAAGADEVAGLAAEGDPVAARVWHEGVDSLAEGLVTAQALFDAEMLVIGGGLARAGETLLEPLREAVAKRLTFHREPLLAAAAFGDEAGCVGAGLLAWEVA